MYHPLLYNYLSQVFQKINKIEKHIPSDRIWGHIEEFLIEPLDFLVYMIHAYLVKYSVNIIKKTQLIPTNSQTDEKSVECT